MLTTEAMSVKMQLITHRDWYKSANSRERLERKTVAKSFVKSESSNEKEKTFFELIIVAFLSGLL